MTFFLLFQLSCNTAVKFARHAVFLFGLGVIPALLSLQLSLEVGRFAFMAGEFVTSLVNKAGLYFTHTARAELQLKDKTKQNKRKEKPAAAAQ